MNNEKIVLVLLSVALIAGVLTIVLSVFGFFTPKLENNAANFQKFSSVQNSGDICAVPAGIDPVQWKEHLSHHPELYAQCLK